MEQLGNILVVDDDDTFRRRIARAFRDRGYETFEAGSIKEANAQLSGHAIKLVLLDLKLGKESGLTFLRDLKDCRDVRVVVLTGYGTIATAVEAVKLGAMHYLTKPTNADAVLAAFAGAEAHNPDTPHLAQVEWEYIQRVMSENEGNISRASKALGLHRRSLQRKLAKSPQKLR